jgi:hypothetical protein
MRTQPSKNCVRRALAPVPPSSSQKKNVDNKATHEVLRTGYSSQKNDCRGQGRCLGNLSRARGKNQIFRGYVKRISHKHWANTGGPVNGRKLNTKAISNFLDQKKRSVGRFGIDDWAGGFRERARAATSASLCPVNRTLSMSCWTCLSPRRNPSLRPGC